MYGGRLSARDAIEEDGLTEGGEVVVIFPLFPAAPGALSSSECFDLEKRVILDYICVRVLMVLELN